MSRHGSNSENHGAGRGFLLIRRGRCEFIGPPAALPCLLLTDSINFNESPERLEQNWSYRAQLLAGYAGLLAQHNFALRCNGQSDLAPVRNGALSSDPRPRLTSLRKLNQRVVIQLHAFCHNGDPWHTAVGQSFDSQQ